MHEVVDLGDSGDEDVGADGDEDGEDDHDELERRRPRNIRESGPEESVMVLDSDSDSDSNEEDEEEFDQGRAGHIAHHQSHAGYRPMAGENSSFSGCFDCAHFPRGHKRRSRRANRDRKQF